MHKEIEDLYRAIAEECSPEELLQQFHDAFGQKYDLRPPLDELRLARLCKPKALGRKAG